MVGNSKRAGRVSYHSEEFCAAASVMGLGFGIWDMILWETRRTFALERRRRYIIAVPGSFGFFSIPVGIPSTERFRAAYGNKV